MLDNLQVNKQSYDVWNWAQIWGKCGSIRIFTISLIWINLFNNWPALYGWWTQRNWFDFQGIQFFFFKGSFSSNWIDYYIFEKIQIGSDSLFNGLKSTFSRFVQSQLPVELSLVIVLHLIEPQSKYHWRTLHPFGLLLIFVVLSDYWLLLLLRDNCWPKNVDGSN